MSLNVTWFYTAAVYAAAVAFARRLGVDLPKRVALFFYALVFVFLYLPLTQDYVNLPVDFLATLPPWVYDAGRTRVVNAENKDLTLQIVPWADQVRQSWRSLTPPLWNNFSACGYPLLASAQSSALSPLRILGLPLSLAHAMTFEAAMKILIALTFMFLWCRRRGYSEIASAFGAVSFGFSTFIVVWLHFPIVTTACFIPAVFYLVDLLAERATYARFVAAAAVWALMLFGGHPETVSHTFFMAALYVLWVVFVERAARPRLFVTLASAMIVAGLLAAPLLAPFAEAVTKSKRYQELQSNPLRPEVPYSDWYSGKLLLQPHFYGAVPHESWGPARAESITGYAGYLGIAAWLAVAAHVIARRKWRSHETFFVLATVLVVGVIMSWPGISEFFHVVFRLAANARVRLFLALLLSILTAASIDLIRVDRRSVVIGLAGAAAMLLFLLTSTRFAIPYHRQAAIVAMLPAAAVLLVAAVAVFLSRIGRNRSASAAVLVLLTFVIADLWIASRDWYPVVSGKWMYPKPAIVRALDELRAKIPANAPFRITGSGPTMFPNTSAVYGYEDMRAHDPMTNGRYIGLLSLITSYDASNYFADWKEFDKRLVDFLNVRYVLTTPRGELPPRYRMVYDGNDGRIFENTDVLPRFFAVRNVVLEFRDDVFYERLRSLEGWSHTALLEKLDLEAEQQRLDFFAPRPADAPVATTDILRAGGSDYRLHVNAPRWTLVVSSVPWWPGWKVERSGARIQPMRVNGGFLGFAVPPGEVDVRVWYDPWTFRFGAILSAATIAALAAFGVWRTQRQHAT